jgi:sulfur-oxidizing protein SoxY
MQAVGAAASTIDRRALLRAGVGLVAITVAAPAEASSADEVAAAIQELIGDIVPVAGGIALQAPETAENGAVVPLTIAVDSPMTDAQHVRAIHVIATRNPTPGVASYWLGPLSGKAQVTARMRLAEKQTVIVLAALSDGTVRRVTADISVNVGGCLT